jgi:hypothetical protein
VAANGASLGRYDPEDTVTGMGTTMQPIKEAQSPIIIKIFIDSVRSSEFSQLPR